MAEGGEEMFDIGDDIVNKLPSIPSSDEVAAFEDDSLKPDRQGSMDERLHRLRAVTQGVIAARKFRRSSSIQGKYVAITPNERDNLEHIQHMTEDITVRLEKLRDLEMDPPLDVQKDASPTPPQFTGDVYVPTAVQGKFVEFVPFDALSRPSSLHPLHPSLGTESSPRTSDISPLPPVPSVDSFAFVNGVFDDLGDHEGDEVQGAIVTASLEQRLRELSEQRTQ